MQNQIHWAEIELLAAPLPPASLGRIFSLPLPASGGCSIPWLAAPGLPSLPHGPTTSSSLVCVQFPSASLISTLMMAFKDTPPPTEPKILISKSLAQSTSAKTLSQNYKFQEFGWRYLFCGGRGVGYFSAYHIDQDCNTRI